MATTTASLIRDRAIAVIGGLTPLVQPVPRFRGYRNEGSGDFREWALANPDGSMRRVQVRDIGDDRPPLVSNMDVELRSVTFEIVIAYPQTSRAGSLASLDRDTMMRSDFRQIDYAIGMCGKQNFSSPYPDATWDQGEGPAGTMRMERSQGVDFLVIENTYSYYQSTSVSDEVTTSPFWLVVNHTYVNATDGLDFTVSIGQTLSATYNVFAAPKGASTYPILDLPNGVGDRTSTTFRVTLASALTDGDVVSFLIVG